MSRGLCTAIVISTLVSLLVVRPWSSHIRGEMYADLIKTVFPIIVGMIVGSVIYWFYNRSGVPFRQTEKAEAVVAAAFAGVVLTGFGLLSVINVVCKGYMLGVGDFLFEEPLAAVVAMLFASGLGRPLERFENRN